MFKIGVFDSGIGGFSILKELIHQLPDSEFYYYSDEAHAPYGDKSDEYIQKRSQYIVEELIKKNVDIIVVACNTATAASIDSLRDLYPKLPFVGIEPYLNAYKKEHLESKNAKIVVLTTESMGKSTRFKNLKLRFDPEGNIKLLSLKNLAHGVDDYFYGRLSKVEFEELLKKELSPIKDQGFTHAILGCTHYPLVREQIESYLHVRTLSPCPYVAARVKELLLNIISKLEFTQSSDKKNSSNSLIDKKRSTSSSIDEKPSIYFCSSPDSQWNNLENHLLNKL